MKTWIMKALDFNTNYVWLMQQDLGNSFNIHIFHCPSDFTQHTKKKKKQKLDLF